VATGGAVAIGWVAVGAGVQVGSSIVAVMVGVTTIDGGTSVRVGIETTGVKTDTAAAGVAVALSLRSERMVYTNRPATTTAAQRVSAAKTISILVIFLFC
jgi:hypothetical protein